MPTIKKGVRNKKKHKKDKIRGGRITYTTRMNHLVSYSKQRCGCCGKKKYIECVIAIRTDAGMRIVHYRCPKCNQGYSPLEKMSW